MLEDTHASDLINKIPVDVENSTLGNDIMNLLDTLKGVNSLVPYCDVSTRILMRISDLL